ncbi:related to UV-damaged DNA-binding protein [Rhynchosporium secalis]|uniref:DNA damage-binding protein 1 n=1 Tax=Rhynchosporium secalis TaxID=38038 RepID=A0A1E1M8T9_RHYSE|nr:related to UV-damaged DNA-binding protein [Rhynchosporium secalis]
MSYLAPIHRPSSVRYAIKLCLLDAEQECLVLAKGNRIEIWTQTEEDGLVMLSSKPIYGRISMLAKVRPEGSPTDMLFVGTSRFQYIVLAYNKDTNDLELRQSFQDVQERHMRDSQSRDLCLIDPTGKYVVLELFEGILTCNRIFKPRRTRTGCLEEKFESIRISEIDVRATTFLYTETEQPKIAFLYEDGIGGEVRLATYRLVDEKLVWSRFETSRHRENEVGDLDESASHLIPIPKNAGQKRYIVRNAAITKAHLGGVVVIGESKFTYLDDESKAIIEYSLPNPTIFVSWVAYDDLRYLLGDMYGNLHIMTISCQDAEVIGMELIHLGKTSKPEVMVDMGGGVFFIGSHEGDSQVVKIDTSLTDLEDLQWSIEILQTMDNIAPVLDFEIMDLGGQNDETQSNEYSTGQARLVTGSGAFENGSLRSVRSGVGLKDLGVLVDDLQDIQDVFALRSTAQSDFDDLLVVSLPTETRVFTFDGQEIEEVDSFRNLQMDCQTLLAMNLPDGMMLQVTEASVAISGPGPSYGAAEWKPPQEKSITSASANDGHILVSASGTVLVSLDVKQGLKEVAAWTLEQGNEIACVHVPSAISGIGFVGFWKSGTVSVLNLSNLEVIFSENLTRKNNASIPRHIVLAQILPEKSSGPTLFVAMEDGVVLTFSVDKLSHSLSGRKSIILGTQHAQLHILPRKGGLSNVLATCEHPSLIYGSEGRINYAAVTVEDATSACSFNSELFPDSVVVATSTNLKISEIDTERRTHVRTLPMGRTVRRIAYSPAERAFGIGCIERQLRKGEEEVISTFTLVEDMSFGRVGQPYVFEDSNGPELIECILRTQLPSSRLGNDAQHELVERFVIGTSFLDEELSQENNVKGRILVFGIDDNRNPFLVSSHNLKSACRRVAMMDGKIVAALTKTVVVFEFNETSEKSGEFTKLATFRSATVPIDLSVSGNIIAVADMMQSVAIVEYVPGKGALPGKLVQVAKDYQAFWATAVTEIGENSWLEADHDGNLIVLDRNIDGPTLEDRKRMQVTSELNLGDQVNVIRRINIEPSPNAMIVPKAFLGTTEGSIYLYSTILPASQDVLMRLQEQMARHVPTVGDLDFKLYRSFKNAERETSEPFRFVDGELIERFLDLDVELQETICQGLGPSVEDVRNMVEELKKSQ